MDFPACFVSRKQYDLWIEAEKRERVTSSGYCTDCTPAYQARMKAEGRCEHPNTTFGQDGDGFTNGMRPIEVRRAA